MGTIEKYRFATTGYKMLLHKNLFLPGFMTEALNPQILANKIPRRLTSTGFLFISYIFHKYNQLARGQV